MIHSELSFAWPDWETRTRSLEMSRVMIEYGLTWRWTAKRVVASIRAANVNVLVARANGRIVGFAIMRYGDDDAHLDLLAVAPAYRRSGVARQLLQMARKVRCGRRDIQG